MSSLLRNLTEVVGGSGRSESEHLNGTVGTRLPCRDGERRKVMVVGHFAVLALALCTRKHVTEGGVEVLKSEKEVLSKELNDKFTRAKSVVVAEFKKLDVETVNKLRRKLREGKVEWKVLKNTIARRAAKGTSVELVSMTSSGRWLLPSATTT